MSMINANGTLDLTTELGKTVITATEAMEVIRPQLRMMRIIYQGTLNAARKGWLAVTEDLEMTDPGDIACDAEIFECLQGQAMENVQSFCSDMGKVYARDQMAEFIRTALGCAMVDEHGCEMLPHGALCY